MGCSTNQKAPSVEPFPVFETDSMLVDYLSRPNYTASIHHIDSLLVLDLFEGHQLAVLYYEKGRYLNNLDKHVEALGSLNHALVQFEEEGNQLFTAKTNELLADAHSFLGKEELAYEYIQKALKQYEAMGKKRNQASAYNSLSHVQFLRGDLSGAAGLVKEAMKIQNALKDSFGLASAYNNLGFIYEKMADPQQAIFYYQMAVNIKRELSPFSSIALINLAAVYNDIGFKSEANSLLLEALAGEKNNNNLTAQREIYDALLRIAIGQEDTENSFLYIHKKDSVSTIQGIIENEEKLSLVEKQYDLAVRDKELEQVVKINNKNKIIFVVSFAMFFLGGLLLFFKNRNKELILTQDKLRLEQKVLRSQMNPHFIFNALSAIQNSLMNNDPIQSASYLARFAKLIRQNFDFINRKTITLSEELDALINYMDTQKMRFHDKFEYVINLADDIDEEEVTIPPLLIQPFVENAIEHGFKNKRDKGLISITISTKKDFICYEIKDNGSGYSTRKKDNKIHSTDIFKERIRLFGEKGNSTFEISPSDEGTTIKFCLKS